MLDTALGPMSRIQALPGEMWEMDSSQEMEVCVGRGPSGLGQVDSAELARAAGVQGGGAGLVYVGDVLTDPKGRVSVLRLSGKSGQARGQTCKGPAGGRLCVGKKWWRPVSGAELGLGEMRSQRGQPSWMLGQGWQREEKSVTGRTSVDILLATEPTRGVGRSAGFD